MEEFARIIIDQARRYGSKELLARAEGVDREGRVPEETLSELAELGYLGLVVPEAQGGTGQDMVTVAACIEEMGRACASTAFMVAQHNLLVCKPLLGAPEALRERWLAPLMEGRAWGAFACHEAGARGLEGLEAEARPLGDGFVLDGRKGWVANAYRADLMLVVANLDGAPSLFAVDAKEARGLSVCPPVDSIGLKGVSFATVIFQGVEAALVAGTDGVEATLAAGRLGLAALALGVSRAALSEGVAYGLERKQFGQAILSFEALRGYVAEMDVAVEGAGGLVRGAARALDKGQGGLWAARAKLGATQAANEVAQKALQIHGGYGYIKDYPIERLIRDAKVLGLLLGSPDDIRHLISDEVIRGAER